MLLDDGVRASSSSQLTSDPDLRAIQLLFLTWTCHVRRAQPMVARRLRSRMAVILSRGIDAVAADVSWDPDRPSTGDTSFTQMQQRHDNITEYGYEMVLRVRKQVMLSKARELRVVLTMRNIAALAMILDDPMGENAVPTVPPQKSLVDASGLERKLRALSIREPGPNSGRSVVSYIADMSLGGNRSIFQRFTAAAADGGEDEPRRPPHPPPTPPVSFRLTSCLRTVLQTVQSYFTQARETQRSPDVVAREMTTTSSDQEEQLVRRGCNLLSSVVDGVFVVVCGTLASYIVWSSRNGKWVWLPVTILAIIMGVRLWWSVTKQWMGGVTSTMSAVLNWMVPLSGIYVTGFTMMKQMCQVSGPAKTVHYSDVTGSVSSKVNNLSWIICLVSLEIILVRTMVSRTYFNQDPATEVRRQRLVQIRDDRIDEWKALASVKIESYFQLRCPLHFGKADPSTRYNESQTIEYISARDQTKRVVNITSLRRSVESNGQHVVSNHHLLKMVTAYILCSWGSRQSLVQQDQPWILEENLSDLADTLRAALFRNPMISSTDNWAPACVARDEYLGKLDAGDHDQQNRAAVCEQDRQRCGDPFYRLRSWRGTWRGTWKGYSSGVVGIATVASMLMLGSQMGQYGMGPVDPAHIVSRPSLRPDILRRFLASDATCETSMMAVRFGSGVTQTLVSARLASSPVTAATFTETMLTAMVVSNEMWLMYADMQTPTLGRLVGDVVTSATQAGVIYMHDSLTYTNQERVDACNDIKTNIHNVVDEGIASHMRAHATGADGTRNRNILSLINVLWAKFWPSDSGPIQQQLERIAAVISECTIRGPRFVIGSDPVYQQLARDHITELLGDRNGHGFIPIMNYLHYSAFVWKLIGMMIGSQAGLCMLLMGSRSSPIQPAGASDLLMEEFLQVCNGNRRTEAQPLRRSLEESRDCVQREENAAQDALRQTIHFTVCRYSGTNSHAPILSGGRDRVTEQRMTDLGIQEPLATRPNGQSLSTQSVLDSATATTTPADSQVASYAVSHDTVPRSKRPLDAFDNPATPAKRIRSGPVDMVVTSTHDFFNADNGRVDPPSTAMDTLA
jgi:hypothetical protein